MKAITYYKYGSTENLRLEEIEKPVPAAGEVLLKVQASSVNSWDWDILRGKPFIVRMGSFFKPKHRVLGIDVAGVVESVGKNVKRFKPGDEVYADLSSSHWGGFAEYVCAPESQLALKPPNLTFEEAASIPHAGVLALQSLRHFPNLNKAHRVLINGAGGGVGTIAIQLLKKSGAEITAVDRADKLDMLRSIGAHHTIDYAQEDYTRNGQQYDLIIDVVARRSASDYRRALCANGIFVMVGGDISLVFSILLRGLFSSFFGNKKLQILVHRPNGEDLDFLKNLYESGELLPFIDEVFPLADVPKAMQRLGEGMAKGKLVIAVQPSR